MNDQWAAWLRWGIDSLGTLAALYARYTHVLLKEERMARERSVMEMDRRMTAVEIQAATSARDSEILEKVRDKLEMLTGVVYQIAGHLGIQTKG